MVEGLEIPSRPKGGAATTAVDVRERWRMSSEARGLMLVSAVLMAFGLAVLFSSSAFVAEHDFKDPAFFLKRQLTSVAVGIFVFAVAAKFDADKLREWAWPMMCFT